MRRGIRACVRWFWKVGLGMALLTFLITLSLRWLTPPSSALMIQRMITAWWNDRETYRIHYTWVNWEAISPYIALAVVAAEDQKFPHHLGFDTTAIAAALKEHRAGGRLRGASTISQQVAKNLFLWPSPSFVRKGIEAYFTVLLEALWSKRRILEVYLNLAEFGQGVFGVAAASEAFFDTSPAQLEAQEAALLAAVLPSPLRWHVANPSTHVLKRRAWIMRQMRQLGGAEYLHAL